MTCYTWDNCSFKYCLCVNIVSLKKHVFTASLSVVNIDVVAESYSYSSCSATSEHLCARCAKDDHDLFHQLKWARWLHWIRLQNIKHVVTVVSSRSEWLSVQSGWVLTITSWINNEMNLVESWTIASLTFIWHPLPLSLTHLQYTWSFQFNQAALNNCFDIFI